MKDWWHDARSDRQLISRCTGRAAMTERCPCQRVPWRLQAPFTQARLRYVYMEISIHGGTLMNGWLIIIINQNPLETHDLGWFRGIMGYLLFWKPPCNLWFFFHCGCHKAAQQAITVVMGSTGNPVSGMVPLGEVTNSFSLSCWFVVSYCFLFVGQNWMIWSW